MIKLTKKLRFYNITSFLSTVKKKDTLIDK